MPNVVFYKDSIDTFECDVKIEGASSSQSKSRLVLEFSDRTLLFNGDIQDGHVSIQIPKLSEISDSQGNAILEIIADQTYFEAWTSSFALKNKKSVAIAEVSINSDSTKVIIKNVSKETKATGIYKPSCTSKNKKFVTESFDRFKSLSKQDKTKVKKALREFTPKSTVEKWADTVFNDADTLYAKLCMYEVQKGTII